MAGRGCGRLLCRMGRHDVSEGVDHQVVGLLDTTAADNPRLGFVLADTADYLARCASAGKRASVHCVRAENRTPAVAAAYLIRSQGWNLMKRSTGSRTSPDPDRVLPEAGLRTLVAP